MLMATVAYFWSESRYPRLNEKGSGAGQEMLSDKLTDRPVFTVDIDAPLWERVSYSTVNWLDTNKLGMGFGLLLAAISLSIFNFVKAPKFSNPFLNNLCGAITGAPLGVCVNCAAPIAKGLFKGGVSGNFSLALMFSSPKFNVVIFTMVVSLFPFYLVAIKYAFTLLFLFLVLPLLVGITLPKNDTSSQSEFGDAKKKEPATDWLGAGANILLALWNNTVYIVKKVVPFMILAGFLGALASQLLSLDQFIGGELSLWKIMVLSGFALFLPMPIGVDILLAEMLSSSGGLSGYVSISLFSLGIFSVYSFLIVWKYFSKKLAWLITGSLFILSVVNGYTAEYYFNKTNNEAIAYYEGAMQYIGANPGKNPNNPSRITTANPIQAVQQSGMFSRHNLSIGRYDYTNRLASDQKLFSKYPGSDFGIQEEFIHPDELWEPFFYGRGMASGDLNNDGWTDLVLARRKGISIYLGNGSGFIEHHTQLRHIDSLSILVAAFVDIDNDGFVDIFLSSYEDGNYFILNEGRNFINPKTIRAPGPSNAVTMAVTFSDLDQDSWLDFYLGNWGFGSYTRYIKPRDHTANALVWNRNLEFKSSQIENGSAETLTVLFSDFNNDNKMDLLVGNDFKPADEYYVGTDNGLVRSNNKDNLYQVSPYYTMTVATADINNDLLLDTYAAGLNFDGPELTKSEKEYFGNATVDNDEHRNFCDCYENTEKYARCLEIMRWRELMPRRDPRLVNLKNCEAFKEDLDQYKESLAMSMVFEAIKRKDASLCDMIDPESEVQRELCSNYFNYLNEDVENISLVDDAIAQKKGQNALHLGNPGHQLSNVSATSITNNTGWTWNSKFADVDNDQWQDLFVVNGCWWDKKIYNMNYFFKNEGGEFLNRSQLEMGLDDVGITHAFLYVDIDNDGDLDIITRSAIGQIFVYRNNESENASIDIKLIDHDGNRDALGAKIFIAYGDGKQQMRELTLGGGFMSYQVPVAHFGLGQHDHIQSLTIRWPGGQESVIDSALSAGSKYVIERQTLKKDLVHGL